MITAFAPATVANLNCGFDVLGLAIETPGDEVSVWWNDVGEIRIVKIEGDEGKLSYMPEENTATGGILTMFEKVGKGSRGIDVAIKKKMPFGSGLGSSAASAVAGVMAVNKLMGSPFTKTELVEFALDGEVIASGSRHADNVAPSMMGGIVLIKSYHPLEIVQLPVPEGLWVTVIHPQIEILTKEARNILPKEIGLKEAIIQTGNIAGFVSALYTGDFELMGKSMTDRFAEPYRAALIPQFDLMRTKAMLHGAISFGISGSGPSVFAFSKGEETALKVATAVKSLLNNLKIETNSYTSAINQSGAKAWHDLG